MAQKKTSKPIPVESTKHKDTRVNIPTEELRNFVREDELTPKTMLYPRDPSLDPQLVWKGKDEQDREDLAVPTVPVYIQEKIHPQALIENLRETSKAGEPEPELMLFDDFNGIKDFETKVDFYNHEQSWTNRMILGDSLLVMNSLAEKEGLKGKVQMIYIDPPYGIKFGSNWQVSTRKRDIKDGKAEDATRQPEQIKAFRDTWELGIHSYLSYLRDRLVVSRELLTETGSVFVQIGDENTHLVRSLMDEVFGSANYVSMIYFATTGGFSTAALSRIGDHLLWYAKDSELLKYRQLYSPKPNQERGDDAYKYLELRDGSRRTMTYDERVGATDLPAGARIYRLGDICGQGQANQDTPFDFQGKVYRPTANSHWKAGYPAGMHRLGVAGRMALGGSSPSYVRFLEDNPVNSYNNVWMDTGHAGFASDKRYVVETNTRVVERCVLMTTDPGDLVLDPTCGSGTTACVAEEWGRRWITLDTSRVALALARTRLMSAKYPYYMLSDSPDGISKESEVTGILPSQQKTEGDIKKGFVYKRVPHVTLKSIANNVEIDTIHARWQEKLGPLLAEINKTLGKSWEEWEVPRGDVTDGADGTNKTHESHETHKSHESHSLLRDWWTLRRQRQKEMDASIARNADTELLYDQPYEDNKRIRVTGPFTVESLSPHRKLVKPKGRLEDAGTGWTVEEMAKDDYYIAIIENLRKAGVQNTIKNERLKFDRLEWLPNADLHAIGEYTENGESKRAAVWVGPQFSSVRGDDIRHAAKESVKGISFDTLIVCGFAFEPSVSEEAKQYGNLSVLIVRMNPDLMMGDELLKKTGAANLFMIFGEPDIRPVDRDGKLVPGKDGKIVVEIKGLDIYDPTTGEIRSNSTDDIACWFIDTDYDGESFFVRHAYFTGADQPYERLRKALKAEINEEAWSSLYRTVSRPFDPPGENRKVAIKVINHYGDEVLKVYDVSHPAI